nr:IclR family transcriptional regulator [Propionibacterium sp.]
MPPTQREIPVSVIKRASLLLEGFGPDRQTLSLADLIRSSGLPRSTAHRLAEELTELGWLNRVDGGYQLGMRLFELGELVPVQRNLSQLALPHMEDLRTATGASVHLAILDGTEVVYLQVLSAKQAPPMNSRRGGRLPAHVTGVGKAMLAFADPQTVQRVLATGLPPMTPRSITTPGHLNRELAAIRASGIAYDREESNVGVLCAAAPVFGPDGGVRAAISVSGFNRRLAPRMGPAVQTAALALSRELNRASLLARRR